MIQTGDTTPHHAELVALAEPLQVLGAVARLAQ